MSRAPQTSQQAPSGMSASTQQQISAGLAAAAAKYGESLHRSSQQSAALAQMQQLGSFGQSRGPPLHSQSSPALDSLYHFAGSHHEPGTGPPYFGGGGGSGLANSRKPSLISGYHNPSIGGSNGPNLSGALNPLSLPGGAFYSSMMSAGLAEEMFGKGNKSSSSLMGNSGGGGGGGKLGSASPVPSRTSAQSAANSNAQMPSYAALTQPLMMAATTGLALKGIGHNHPQYQLFLQDEIQQLKHKDPQQLFQIQMQREKQIYSQLQQPPLHQRPSSSSLSSTPTSAEMPKSKEAQPAPPPSHHHHHHHHSSLIGSQSSMPSSTYVPQVEAISPTPEDQRENSNLQAIKDKIITEIYKVEKDFASTQYQLEMIKKKQIELQSRQVTAAASASSSSQAINLPAPETTMTLAEKIYQENRKKATESHRQVLKPMQNTTAAVAASSANTMADGRAVPDANSIEDCIPFYHEFSDTKHYYEMRAHYEQHLKPRLVQIIKRQSLLRAQKERGMADKYDEMHAMWQKKCDRFENSVRKKQKDAKYRELFEKIFPELRKQREERERLLQKQRAAIDLAVNNVNLVPTGASAVAAAVVPLSTAKPPGELQTPLATATAESQSAADASELTALEDERRRVLQLAVVPPLMLDVRQRRYKFINTNGYVQDPVALFKAAKNEVYWTEKEKEIFLEKLLTFGKNFEIISTYLDKKRVQDCIEYYYLTKKKVNYKMLIRKHQRKRKREVKNTGAAGGAGGGGAGSGASGGGSSSNGSNSGASLGGNHSSSTNQSAGSTGNSANSTNASINLISRTLPSEVRSEPCRHLKSRFGSKVSRESLREILRRLTQSATNAWQPTTSSRNAEMLRRLSNPGPEQTTIMVYTASVANSPSAAEKTNCDKSPSKSPDTTQADSTAFPHQATTSPSPKHEENTGQSAQQDEKPPTNCSGASISKETAHPSALTRGQIVDFINDAIKNALNTDIEMPKPVTSASESDSETRSAAKSPGTGADVAPSAENTASTTTIKNNESIVLVNKPLTPTLFSRDEDASHAGEAYPRIDPTMKISSSISFVVDHLTRGKESPESVSPDPTAQVAATSGLQTPSPPSTVPKTALGVITDLINKELKAADPMPPPPPPSTSCSEPSAKSNEAPTSSQENTNNSALATNGCTLGTWVDTLISKRMYDEIATSPPPSRAKITTAAMMQANATTADQLFDIHSARIKTNFAPELSHYARLKAEQSASGTGLATSPNGPAKAPKALERAPSRSGSTISSSVSSPSSSLSVSPNNNNETAYATGRRPSDYDGESKSAASPSEAKKSKLTEDPTDGDEACGKMRKLQSGSEMLADRRTEEAPDRPFLVRSRKSSLTMKILQGQSNDEHPATETTRPALPAASGENVWNSMLGGLIMKSLGEELPPPINISDPLPVLRPAPQTMPHSPKGASKRPFNPPVVDDGVVDITADDSSDAPTPQQQAALAAIAAASGIHTKDLIMQARSYGQQVQSQQQQLSKPPTPGRPSVMPPSMNPAGAHRLAMEHIATAGLNPQQQQQLMSYLTAQNGMRFNQSPSSGGGANSSSPNSMMPSTTPSNPMALLIQKQIQEIEQQQRAAGPGRSHPGMLPPSAASYSPRNAGNQPVVGMSPSPSPPTSHSQLAGSLYAAATHPKSNAQGPGGISPNLMAAIMSATTAALAGSPSMSSALIERTATAVAAAAAAYMSSPVFGGGGGSAGDAGMLDPMVLQQIIHAVVSTTNMSALNELPKAKPPQLPPNTTANYLRASAGDIAGAHAFLQQQQHQHMMQQQQQQLQAAHHYHQASHGGLHHSYLHSPTSSASSVSSNRLKSPLHPYASLAESMIADPTAVAATQALLASSGNHHHQRMNTHAPMSSPVVVQHGLKNPTSGSPSAQQFTPASASNQAQPGPVGSQSSAPQQSFKKRLLSSLEASASGQATPPLSTTGPANPNYALNKMMASNALAKTQYEYLSDTDQ